jgi:(S)-3,5-dihydroxyphenylglycine transaminase
VAGADDRGRARGESGGVDISELNSALGDPVLDSMNFLNEVAARFPRAVSFAPGRPCEDFFAFDDLERCLRRYREFLTSERGYSEAQVVTTLFQYGRTKGIIHREIARYLETDEGLAVDPESIVVTVGAQEAMYLVARALCRDERDAALVVSPAYVGFIGAARLAGLPVLPVAGGPGGIDLDDLRRQVREARRRGLRPRCVYVVPDFSNPSGIRMDLALRRELLRAAAEEDLLIVEDDPYGTFPADGERLPTLKALDPDRRVVYLGSFAKTVLPGVRVGFIVADQLVTGAGRRTGGFLADELGKLKSMVTVNTPSLSQAVVAGRLLEHGFSLLRANARAADLYRRNMALIRRGLRDRFPDEDGPVRWNEPAGGFFLVLTVPFQADDALLEHSAREHRVLWTPMSHFYAASPGGRRELRLSCSSLTPQDIETGLDRLAKFIAEQSPPSQAGTPERGRRSRR